MTTTLYAAPLSWSRDVLFTNSTDEDWISFAPTTSFLTSSLTPPAGMWTMDNFYRGRNLGSEGQRLNCSDTGLVWSKEGPLGSGSDLKYAYFNGIKTPRIQNRHNGSYLLDFTKPFTITMWVKTNRHGVCPIIQTWNSDLRKYAQTSLWFHPSKFRNQIYLSANKRIFSHLNNTGRLEWRHIAATYNGIQKYSLYLNAYEWKISKTIAGINFPSDFDIIFIGYYMKPAYRFKGAMACLSIFKRALTQQEIREWMQTCP